MQLDALLQELGVGHEEVVTDELNLVAQLSGELLPAFPVVLVEAVLDRGDRILVAELLEECDLALVVKLLAVGILRHAVVELLVVVVVLAVLQCSELRSGAVHGDGHVLAGLVASVLHSLADALESVVDAVECGSVATLVTYSGRETALLQQLAQGVEDLSAAADSFLLALGRTRLDHELLEGDGS